MSSSFPLVRAAALVPFLKWMRAQGRPIDAAMRTAGISVPPWEDPGRVVAFPRALTVLRDLADAEGPDIGRRVVTETSIAELGVFGQAMLSAPTVREAIICAAAAITRHSTCEMFTVTPVSGGAIVRDQLLLDTDQVVRHAEQIFLISIIEALVRASGYQGESFKHIEIVPHPAIGISDVRFGANTVVSASPTRALSVFLPDRVLNRTIPPSAARTTPDLEAWQNLKRNLGFSGTAMLYIETLLDEGVPSIDRFAVAAGISRRTLQRRLAEEDTSFSKLLDMARRERALQEISGSGVSLGSIAADLGYSGQPAFHSAVRRWTSRSPREIRRMRISTRGP